MLKRFLLVLALLAVFVPTVVAAHGGDQVVPNGIRRIGMSHDIVGGLNDVDVDVAIIDTGIDVHHSDLNVAGGYDCTGEIAPGDYDDYGRILFPHQDLNGHGTHVAGTIGAKNNNFGVVGVAPGARLWGVKVLDKDGSGTIDSVVCGLDWVTKHADLIEVANLSLGADFGDADVAPCFDPTLFPLPQDHRLYDTPRDTPNSGVYGGEQPNPFWEDQRLHQAICDAVRAGVTVVVAAGNGGGDAFSGRPSAYDEPIVVSSFADFDGMAGGAAGLDSPCWAKGEDDAFYDYDNFGVHPLADSYHGEQVDISAPGVCVLSTYLDDTFAILTGTSMATPHVTGAAALFKSEYPNASPEKVRAWLLACADDQPANFGDVDEFHEPLLHVCGLDESSS